MLKADYWLRPRNRSRELLILILALGGLAFLLRNAQGTARMFTVLVIALLGAALALGCLLVFPSADIWKAHGPDHEVVNGVRNVLISAVVGAFGLITLFLTYESAQASRISAEVASDQARASRLSEAGTLMGHENNPGIRLAGIEVLRQLLDDEQITQQRAYRILTAYIRSESPWVGSKSRPRWNAMDDDARRAARSSATFGRDSLRKRSPHVQGALDLLAAKSKLAMPNGETTVDFRADLRDLNLQGAALGTAYLQNAILNGTHLDYLDCGVREGQESADLSGADFRGASLFGAILKKVNLRGAHFDAPVNEDGTPRPEQPTVLTNADLTNADLREASFAGATLKGARLTGAVMDKTDFSHAILAGAHVEGADLRGTVGLVTADLSGIVHDEATKWPPGVFPP
jgi:uncharacterized protein YjbI with pentapeptide repeats